MRAVRISKANGPFEIVDRDIPEPNDRQVRIKVQACGVCHSDSFTKEGLFPGIQYPRVPGHEIAGVLDKVGKDVTQWQPGQRVAVGWHGGHDGLVNLAGAVILLLARMHKYQVFPTMVAMPII